jgi:hypothetical protein
MRCVTQFGSVALTAWSLTLMPFAPAVMAQATPAAPAAPAVPTVASLPALKKLSEDELTRLLAAVKELRALDAQEPWSKVRSGTAGNFSKGPVVSAAVGEILRKNGFKDEAEFRSVGYNAALAYSVVKEGGKEGVAKRLKSADEQQARAMEQIAKKLPPDQVEKLKAQLASTMATQRALRDVPDDNVTLVGKYRSQMEETDTRKPAAN